MLATLAFLLREVMRCPCRELINRYGQTGEKFRRTRKRSDCAHTFRNEVRASFRAVDGQTGSNPSRPDLRHYFRCSDNPGVNRNFSLNSGVNFAETVQARCIDGKIAMAFHLRRL